MRLFVAIDLPDAVRRPLAAWRADLPGARWMPAERLHLTLRFIGEVTTERLDAITGQLRSIHAPPVPLTMGTLVALPSGRRPHVLAVSVADIPALARLHTIVERALGEAGVPPDARPLLPHITLARGREMDAGALRRVLQTALPPDVGGVSPSISLVRSEPGASGSVYTALLRVPLR